MMLRAAINGTLLIAALFFSVAYADTLDWVPPTVKIVPSHTTLEPISFGRPLGVCESWYWADAYHPSAPGGNGGYDEYHCRYVDVNENIVRLETQHISHVCTQITLPGGGLGYSCENIDHGWRVAYSYNVASEYIPECKNPVYPRGVDENGDGKFDKCYSSNCSFDAPAFTSGPGAQMAVNQYGFACVKMPNGNSCSYRRGSDSGGLFWRPSGEACTCSSDASAVNACSQFPSNNEEEMQNGCKKSAGVEYCPDDPQQRCRPDKNGVNKCDAGCGYVAQTFMCTKEIQQSDPCKSVQQGENRPSCMSVPPGQCPNGFPNCNKREQQTACEPGDVRPECTGKQPGQCPKGSPECPGAPVVRCGVNDQRPDCTGLVPGSCPRGMICDSPGSGGQGGQGGQGGPGGSGGSGEEGESKDYTAVLDAIKEGVGESKDYLKGLVDGANAPKSEDFENKVNGVVDGDKTDTTTVLSEGIDVTAHEGPLTGISGSLVSLTRGLMPSPSSCSGLRMALPRFSATIDYCSIAPYVRAVSEWSVVVGLVLYIWWFFVRIFAGDRS